MNEVLRQTHSFFISTSKTGEIKSLSQTFSKLIGSVIGAQVSDHLLRNADGDTSLCSQVGEIEFQLNIAGLPGFIGHCIKDNEGLYWIFAVPIPEDVEKLMQLGISIEDLAIADPLRVYIKSISELKIEVEQRSSELIHAERMASIGTLAAGVAHEINNPLAYVKSNLTSLQGFLQPMVKTIQQLLDIEKQSPKVIAELSALGLEYDSAELAFIIDDLDEILVDLRDGSNRIVTIVNGLRQFAHPATQAKSDCDLNDAVRVAIELSRNEFKYHATLDMELADIPMVPANSGEITQVLVNLLVNAGQSIKDSGIIRVRSQKIGDSVEISVEDTGTGINSQDLAQIFTPFFTTKPVGEGTGLGLAISHRIMKEHGGEIIVASEPGKGTQFTLKFPLTTKA